MVKLKINYRTLLILYKYNSLNILIIFFGTFIAFI
jgi:hypothetical protein